MYRPASSSSSSPPQQQQQHQHQHQHRQPPPPQFDEASVAAFTHAHLPQQQQHPPPPQFHISQPPPPPPPQLPFDEFQLDPAAAQQLHHHHHAQPPSGPPPPMATFMMMPGDGGAGAAAPKANRARRKSGPGAENVKHRRTRSGCYTCRTRRVKCDETRPICERCQKGGRECTYPEVVPTAKSAAGPARKREKRTASREGSSSLEDVDEEGEEFEDKGSSVDGGPRLKSSASQSHLRGEGRRESWASSAESRPSKSRKAGSYDASPSPHAYPESSVPTSPASSLKRTTSHLSPVNSADWAHLPHDIAFYLNYHLQSLTCHHYLLKNDTYGFFKTMLLEHAVGNEALLYAVAAFSSFHYSVEYKTGIFQTFLEYYDKSIGLLRVSLNQEHTLETVLTILQLASFEEYLGDWSSLMEHRNAASQIIIQLWTPATLAESPMGRTIYNWFSHFDVLSAMMAGHEIMLPPEWPHENRNVVRKTHELDPESLELMIDDALCGFRDICVTVSVMTAKRAQNKLTLEELLQQSSQMLSNTQNWRSGLNPKMFEESVTYPAPKDCPFEPAPIYRGPRWAVNFLECDYWGLLIMLKHQIALTNSTGPDASIAEHAIKICERLAAIEACPDVPSGSLLAAQASIGLAALWIPNDQRYRRWVRGQLAKAEQMGFVYPIAFRNRMAELWDDPRLKHTWIDDESGFYIGATIRGLVDMRDSASKQDPSRHDIREMRTLMTEMRLDSTRPSDSSSTDTESTTSTAHPP